MSEKFLIDVDGNKIEVSPGQLWIWHIDEEPPLSKTGCRKCTQHKTACGILMTIERKNNRTWLCISDGEYEHAEFGEKYSVTEGFYWELL